MRFVLFVVSLDINLFGDKTVNFFDHVDFFLNLDNLWQHKYLLEYLLHIDGNLYFLGNDLPRCALYFNCIGDLRSSYLLVNLQHSLLYNLGWQFFIQNVVMMFRHSDRFRI